MISRGRVQFYPLEWDWDDYRYMSDTFNLFAWEWVDDYTIDLCWVESVEGPLDPTATPDTSTRPDGVCSTWSDGTLSYWHRLDRYYYGEGTDTGCGDCDADDTGSRDTGD